MVAEPADAASCDRSAVADGTTVATACATTVECGATAVTFDVTAAGLTVTGLTVTGLTVVGFTVVGFTVTILTGGFGATGVVAADAVAGRRKSTTTQRTGHPHDG